MNPVFEHLYDNWKQVYTLPPGEERDRSMRNIRAMTKGNLHWIVRQLIGGIPSDHKENIKGWIANGIMNPPDEFTRRRRHEDLKRQNQ